MRNAQLNLSNLCCRMYNIRYLFDGDGAGSEIYRNSGIYFLRNADIDRHLFLI